MVDSIGRYDLLGQIATGGMAEIHMARQRGVAGFEKLVVIKRLLPALAKNPMVVQLFLNEAKIAAKLTHPNVIQIYDLGKADDDYFIAMEYIQGENLRLVLRRLAERQRLLPLQHILEIAKQVCDGLFYAHSKTDTMNRGLNIVHCDISPQNILISFDGVAKVVDFGIARAAVTLERSEPGLVRGKHGYMSPEQCLGKALDARSDLFSLGVVLWELCTCRRLFRRKDALETSKATIKGEVAPPRAYNSHLSARLEAIVLRSLQIDPGRRFQNALEMGMAIDKELKNLGLEAGSLQLGMFMRHMFADKLAKLKRIEEAQARGERLEREWFFSDATTDSPVDLSVETLPPPLDLGSRASSTAKVSSGNTGLPSPRARPAKSPGRALRLTLVTVLGIAALSLAGSVLYPQRMSLFGGDRPEQPRESVAKTGRIAVRSVPAGAVVFLDGQRRCTTPCQLSDLEPGVDYQLRAVKAGFVGQTTRFRLATGEAVRGLELKLKREAPAYFGSVEVITRPRGALVELDGKLLPKITPMTIERVAANRKHNLRAWILKNQVWVTTFELKPGESKKLEAVLPRPQLYAPEEDDSNSLGRRQAP